MSDPPAAPAEDLRRVDDAQARLMATIGSLSDGAWVHRTRDVGGRERPLFVLPSRRWQELEVHLVDLDLGATMRDWPDDFVSACWPRLRAEACGRLPEGAVLPAPGALDAREELAWLYGRSRRDDLPELAPRQ